MPKGVFKNPELRARRISEKTKGKKGWNKGKKWSNEVKEKISLAHKGKPSWKKGLKGIMPLEERKRLSEIVKKRYIDNPQLGVNISKRMKGANNIFWKGGITPINTKIRMSLEYKLWRTAVFERDNYTCIWCGNKSGRGKAVELQADHIKKFADYPELRFAIDNGRTLCRPCHMTTETWGRKQTKR